MSSLNFFTPAIPGITFPLSSYFIFPFTSTIFPLRGFYKFFIFRFFHIIQCNKLLLQIFCCIFCTARFLLRFFSRPASRRKDISAFFFAFPQLKQHQPLLFFRIWLQTFRLILIFWILLSFSASI